ncbi:MAG: hypothetical protein V1754_14475, partial [Pseudomonadota bacterium]
RKSFLNGEKANDKLIKMARVQRSTVYMDTIISPSITSALAQSLQVPGISGVNNNTAMFELSEHDGAEEIKEVVDGCLFASSTLMSLLVLRHGDLHFGECRSIHIWLTWNDKNNANLMVLLAYILLGHPDWSDAEICVFAALPSNQVAEERGEFERLMSQGRIPISEKNVRFFPVDDAQSFRKLVESRSSDADLVVVGFDLKGLKDRQIEVFSAHPTLRSVLFVQAAELIEIE